MRNMIVCALLSVLAAAWIAGGAATAQERASDKSTGQSKAEEEIMAVLRRQADAGVKRDASVMAELLDEQYFHTNPDGSLMTRAQVLESYRTPTQFTFSDEQLQEVKTLLSGQVCAIANAVVVLQGKRGTDPFTSRYRVTWVLRKSDGKWKMLNSHSSLLSITPG